MNLFVMLCYFYDVTMRFEGYIMSINSFNSYISTLLSDKDIYDFTDKKKCVNTYVKYMINRTQSMFKWNGLPDSIPERILELYLQTNGNVCFYEYDGSIYVFTGGLGGKPDVYYKPTIYTIANPSLNISKSLTIDKECVVMYNDSMLIGLLPLFIKYATQLTETDISINIATINSRIVSLISAPDDRTKASAEKYLDDIRNGKSGIIGENAFLDGVKSQPYGATGYSNSITSLIELLQYQKASLFNEIGLNANYNMKRESINSGESQLNNDALLPLVDDMLNCRREGISKVNAMYGINITVDFNSSWKDNKTEIKLEQKAVTNEKTD